MELNVLAIKPDLWIALEEALDYVMKSETPWGTYSAGDNYCPVGAAMQVGDFTTKYPCRPEELPSITQAVIQSLYFAIPRPDREALSTRFYKQYSNNKHRMAIVREATVINYNDGVLRDKDRIFGWFMVAQANTLKELI